MRRTLAVKARDTANTAILIAQAPIIGLLIAGMFGARAAEEATPENWMAVANAVANAVATTIFLTALAALWFGVLFKMVRTNCSSPAARDPRCPGRSAHGLMSLVLRLPVSSRSKWTWHVVDRQRSLTSDESAWLGSWPDMSFARSWRSCRLERVP